MRRKKRKPADLKSTKQQNEPLVFQVNLLSAYAARTKTSMHILSYVTTAQSTSQGPIRRTFDLKPLNEDGNLQVCMYFMHAQKGASEAPITHFRACKIPKFSGVYPQTSLPQSILWAPLFEFALDPSHPLGGPECSVGYLELR